MKAENFFIVIAIYVATIFLLNILAPRVGLIDIPTERKNHIGEVPLIGGLAFYITTLAACFITLQWLDVVTQLFLFSCGLIVLLGAIDDYKGLSIKLRLAAQFSISCLIIFFADTYIHSLGDILGLGAIDIRAWGILFTFVATLSLINAFNMIDGIDGLAGGLALNTYFCIAILFTTHGGSERPELPMILATGILPFIFFNLGVVPGPIKKIFLGDAGSMFIGLSIIWLFALGTQGVSVAFRPVTALWLVAIPLWDMTAIVYRRIRNRVSPFAASHDHLHHKLMHIGLSSKQALCTILMLSVLCSSIGMLGEYLQIAEYIMLMIYVVLFFTYSVILSRVEYST